MENTASPRRLERIILINSSTFSYAEVSVDGNTHVAGDNSVGKSTFLQIATIFYTGETSRVKLGIGDGKKPFAQYNLAYNNSYIIYEVRRSEAEDDCYMVVLKNTGWPTFNFFDCPYRREMFIGDDDNVAFDNLEKVKGVARRIYGNSLDIRSVHGQDAYLDVLYGYRNSLAGRDRSWEKFSLTTCRGDGRPHRKFAALFTNFLNLGKVQGSELKEMIVSSLDSPSRDFDVPQQRSNAADVVRRFTSIDSWQRDPYLIEAKAQFVSAFESHRREMESYAKYPAQAKWARAEALVSRREIEEELGKAREELERCRQRMEDRREASQSGMDVLQRKITLLEENLSAAARKRKEYSSLIPLVPLMQAEPLRRTLLEGVTRQLDILQGESREMRDRVEQEKKELQSRLTQMHLTTAGDISDRKAKTEEAKSQFRSLVEEERARAEKRHTESVGLLATRKDEALSVRSSLQEQYYKVASSHPHEKDIAAAQDRIAALRAEVSTLDSRIASIESEITILTLRKKDLPDKVRLSAAEELRSLSDKVNALTGHKAELESRLSSFPGSLAQWLGENVEGWEKNVGRVVSGMVLYRSDLSPELSGEGGDTLYGVKIDTGRLPLPEDNPESIRDRISSLDLRLSSASADLARKRAEVEESIRTGQAEVDSLIGEARGRIESATTTRRQKVEEMDALQSKVASLAEEEKRVVSAQLSSIMERLDEVKQTLFSIRDEEEAHKRRYREELEEFRTRTEARFAELDEEFGIFEQESTQILSAFENDIKKQEEALERNLLRSLTKKGLDPVKIEEYALRQKELQEDVATIDAHRTEYTYYLRDKEEYLDHEGEWKDSLSRMREELQLTQSNEREIREREDVDIREMTSDIKGLEEDIASLDVQIKAVDEYYGANRTEEYDQAEPMEVDLEASEIVAQDRASKEKAQNLLTRMENCWMRFKSRLHDDGVDLFFKRANISEDIKEDFMAREDIYHFIKDNIIEDHKSGWKSFALSFVSGISYLASDYTQEVGKVRDTVVNLNRLFRENNFTEVIKRIELSVEDIGTELIALIQKSVPIYRDYGGEAAAGRDFFDGSTGSRIFVNYLKNLSDSLNRYGSDKIRVEDMFDLRIEVDEGLNKSGRKRDIKKMGSNGIDIIFKDMVYLLMLANLRRQFSRGGEGFIVHCPVDEQSTLSPGNFNSLMGMANNLGVYILANSPLFPAGTEDGFKYAYTFWKRQGSEITNATRLFSLREK